MPHLLIRGVTPERIRAISGTLVAELAELCRCPEDYFLLEVLNTTAAFGGEFVPSYPFVEVNWFDRGQDVRDRVAESIDRHIRSQGVEEVEIAFRAYSEDGYYANGKRLAAQSAEESELKALRSENQRLKDELQRARKASQAAGPTMSSKLYDALRE